MRARQGVTGNGKRSNGLWYRHMHFLSARVVAILLVGLLFALRVAGLDRQSLWLDEAISANVALGTVHEIVKWTAGDVHPPLYYVVLHYWTAVAGYGEYALRFISVIGNVLCGVAIYRLAVRMFGRPTASVVLLLFSLSAFQQRYSQEVRMYSVLGAMIGLMLLGTWEYTIRLRWQSLLPVFMAAVAGLYAHYQMGLVILVIDLWFLVRMRSTQLATSLPWWGAQLAIMAAFVLWIPIFLSQVSSGGRYWMQFDSSLSSALSPFREFIWGEWMPTPTWRPEGLPTALSMMGLALSLSGAVIACRQVRRARPILLMCALGVGLPVLAFVVSFINNVYGSKYLIAASIGAYMLVAYSIIRAWNWSRMVGVVLLAAVVAYQVVALYDYHRPENQREDWRGAVSYVERNAGRDDAVAFHFGGPMAPYSYYSVGGLPVYGLLDGLGICRDRMALLTRTHRVIWLFDYLASLYDPGQSVAQELRALGYRRTLQLDFTEVPVTRWVRDPTWQDLTMPGSEWADLKIVNFGPRTILSGEGFNVQPSGESAMWFEVRGVTSDVVLVLDDTRLPMVVGDASVATVAIPHGYFATPGEYHMFLWDPLGQRRSNTVTATVLPAD